MKRMFKLILPTILFSLLQYNAECCICNQKTFEESYAKSDLIFLGRVISSDEDSYSMKVYEFFKGNVSDTIYGALKGSCTIIPTKNENWLIYGNMVDGSLIVRMCYSSRSFNNPMNSDGYFISPPPKEMSLSEYSIYENNALGIELSELYYEIYTMRDRKIIGELKNISYKLTTHPVDKLIYVLIALVLISIVLSTFIIARRKN